MGNNYRSLVSTANRVPRPPAHGYNNISRLFCGSQPSHVPPYPASLLYSFVFCPSFLTLCEMIDRCIGTPLDIPLSLSLSLFPSSILPARFYGLSGTDFRFSFSFSFFLLQSVSRLAIKSDVEDTCLIRRHELYP